MTVEDMISDITDLDNGDNELRMLYNRLFDSFTKKGLEYHQLARSRTSGELRYILSFFDRKSLRIRDLKTNQTYDLAA